jgi:hypothetical protein
MLETTVTTLWLRCVLTFLTPVDAQHCNAARSADSDTRVECEQFDNDLSIQQEQLKGVLWVQDNLKMCSKSDDKNHM